jgi:hypothetical protein
MYKGDPLWAQSLQVRCTQYFRIRIKPLLKVQGSTWQGRCSSFDKRSVLNVQVATRQERCSQTNKLNVEFDKRDVLTVVQLDKIDVLKFNWQLDREKCSQALTRQDRCSLRSTRQGRCSLRSTQVTQQGRRALNLGLKWYSDIAKWRWNTLPLYDTRGE